MDDDSRPFLPLAPAALHILLCLSVEARHGHGIMREVARQSDEQHQLGPGTLYGNLQKLMIQGLVEEAPRPSGDDDPRRRYYRLTKFGRRVLEADISRLKRVVWEASFALRQPHPRRT
jgi:DNA-binding PadR family transcriptional regulator